MLPTVQQYQNGCTRWRSEHEGVSIEISHHGVSEYSPQGTWCYYLILNENMFQRPEDWALFDLPVEVKESSPGRFWEFYPYDDAPDLGWHGGATYGEVSVVFDQTTGKHFKSIKIGCDYAHFFDKEGGFWEGYDDVLRDAQRSAEVLVKVAPQKLRCEYSGKIDAPNRFYTAINGARVHVDAKVPDDLDQWKRKTETAA